MCKPENNDSKNLKPFIIKTLLSYQKRIFISNKDHQAIVRAAHTSLRFHPVSGHVAAVCAFL
jgi:hypothetical protein